jgi:hypothetical protein
MFSSLLLSLALTGQNPPVPDLPPTNPVPNVVKSVPTDPTPPPTAQPGQFQQTTPVPDPNWKPPVLAPVTPSKQAPVAVSPSPQNVSPGYTTFQTACATPVTYQASCAPAPVQYVAKVKYKKVRAAASCAPAPRAKIKFFKRGC